jgi:signal transduction histidine kinase
VAESLALATTLLRAECYRVVVFDQYLLETESREAGSIFEHLCTAIPVPINLAISGMERMVREVRSALLRGQREVVRARRAALEAISSELNGTVTALLLSTELALETPGLPTAAFEKLQSVHGLVKKLRQQLEHAAAAQVEEAKKAASV